MNVLSQLVPAVREVRAPLVGGFLWLLAAWLFVGEHVPAARDVGPGSTWAHLRRVVGVMSPAGVAVALSVAAYLVGSLVGEVIEVVSRRYGFDKERVEALGEAVPETRRLVDTALRIHAEAELRLHVAVPLLLVAVALAVRREWASGLVMVLSMIIGAHGIALIRRAARKGQTSMSAAESVRDELDPKTRQSLSAQVDVRVERERSSRGKAYLVFQNSGTAPATGVTIEPVDRGESLDFLLAGTLPIEELFPGEQIEIPIAVTLGTPPSTRVRVRWLDRTGERSYDRALRLL